VKADEKRLIINDIDWPPFFFLSKGEIHKGLGKELLVNCLTNNNYTIEFKNLPVKRTHAYMQSGDIDITVYSYKEERNQFVLYGSEPIFHTQYGFAVRQDSNIEITSIDDLRPLVIGHLSGLSHTPEITAIIEKNKSKQQVREGYSIESLIAQLLAEPSQFDILPNAKSTILWTAKKLGVSSQIKVLDFTAKQKNYFVTVSKFSKNVTQPEKLLALIDQCLIEQKNNGTYDRISAQYALTGLSK